MQGRPDARRGRSRGPVETGPWFGDVKLDHQLNSVTATKKQIIDIDDYAGADGAGRDRLRQLLQDTMRELREKVGPYKK